MDMKKIIILCALLVAVAMPLAAQNAKKVALLQTLNGDKTAGVKAIELNMVRGELRKAISNQEGFQAFTRTDIDQLMAEHNFQNSGMVADAQRKRLGEMTGAAYICVSTLTKSAPDFYVEAYLIDVESGEISNPATQYGRLEGGTYANLYQLCQDLAQELIGNVAGSNASSRPARPQGGAGSRQGQDFTETAFGIDMRMIYVEGGTFVMGCTGEQSGDCSHDEEPARQTTVGSFYIGMLEVTQSQWQKVMGTTIYQQQSKAGVSITYGVGPDYPMYYVSWEEAREFCARLSRQTGRNYRLATEAEWEYAARGGRKGEGAKYSGGWSVDDVAWYYGNSGNSTHRCGTKRPNALGIYDMSGNVWEWCEDWYGEYLQYDNNNPKGAASGGGRVDRGGSYGSSAWRCRVSYRGDDSPGGRSDFIGFRLVLVP